MRLPCVIAVVWACVGILGISAADAWADHGQIEVHESAGLDREQWPIQVGVPMGIDVSADDLALVNVNADGSLTAVEFQLLAEITPTGTEQSRARWGGRVKTFEIAFLVDLPANSSLELRLYPRDPDSATAQAGSLPSLTVERHEGLARSVDTGTASFTFHQDSGQMTSYRLAGHETTVDLGGRPIYGGGDVWAPDFGRWGNVRNWDLDDEDHAIDHTETEGPIAWQSVFAGNMPNTNGHVEVSVKYTAFAGMPFVLASSRIHFNEATRVNAVRNNQLVFNRLLHTHGIVIDDDGEIVSARAYDPDDTDRRLGHILGHLAPNVPFVGMYHDEDRYGIGVVALGRANHQTRRPASPQDYGAHHYFFDVTNPRLSFFYVLRAEVFPADFDGVSHSWHSTVVAEGADFVSHSAILVFELDEAGQEPYAGIERWTKLLRNPPRVSTRWVSQ